MIRTLLSTFLLIMTLGPLALLGQSSAWIGLRTKSELSKKWELATFSETRYRLNKISPERAFTEMSPSRKVGNHFAVSAPVRFTAFGKPSQRSHEVRLGLQAIAKANLLAMFNLKYRSFYQWDKSVDGKDFQKSYWRHKFDLKRNWNSKFASQIEQEFWHDFTATGKIDRYRLIVSNLIAVKGDARLYIAYLMQSPIFQGISSLERIGVLRYQMKF